MAAPGITALYPVRHHARSNGMTGAAAARYAGAVRQQATPG